MYKYVYAQCGGPEVSWAACYYCDEHDYICLNFLCCFVLWFLSLFFPQPSLDTPLVIDGYLVCQTVIVQILPVNKFGPAQNYMYSSNLTIVTDGGQSMILDISYIVTIVKSLQLAGVI